MIDVQVNGTAYKVAANPKETADRVYVWKEGEQRNDENAKGYNVSFEDAIPRHIKFFAKSPEMVAAIITQNPSAFECTYSKEISDGNRYKWVGLADLRLNNGRESEINTDKMRSAYERGEITAKELVAKRPDVYAEITGNMDKYKEYCTYVKDLGPNVLDAMDVSGADTPLLAFFEDTQHAREALRKNAELATRYTGREEEYVSDLVEKFETAEAEKEAAVQEKEEKAETLDKLNYAIENHPDDSLAESVSQNSVKLIEWTEEQMQGRDNGEVSHDENAQEEIIPADKKNQDSAGSGTQDGDYQPGD